MKISNPLRNLVVAMMSATALAAGAVTGAPAHAAPAETVRKCSPEYEDRSSPSGKTGVDWYMCLENEFGQPKIRIYLDCDVWAGLGWRNAQCEWKGHLTMTKDGQTVLDKDATKTIQKEGSIYTTYFSCRDGGSGTYTVTFSGGWAKPKIPWEEWDGVNLTESTVSAPVC